MSGISQTAIDTALALTMRPEVLGIMGAVLIALVSTMVTWLIMRNSYVVYLEAFGPYESVLFLRFENLASSIVVLITSIPRSVVDSVRSVFDIVTSDLFKIVTLLIMGIVCMGYLAVHNEIIPAMLRIRQCDIVPLIESIPLRLLNVVRILYDSIYPLANVGFEIQHFILTGWRKVLISCSAGDDIFIVFQAIGNALGELARALGTFFGAGMLTSRLDLIPFFYQIGLAFNALSGPLACFCLYLEDLFDLVISIPQIDELHEGLSAVVNIPVRAFQLVITTLMSFATTPVGPDFTELSEEIITAETQLLETVRIIILYIFEFLVALLDTINIIIPTEYSAAIKISLQRVMNDGTNESVPDLGKITLADMMHAALRTTASPLYKNAVSKNPELANDPTAQAPIWDIPPDTPLSEILGLRRLLLILETRWSYIVSKPIATGVSVANMTLNIISRSYDLFDTPDGLAYFQFNRPFGYLREGFTALGKLGIFFDEDLDDVNEGLTTGILYYVEAVFEIFFGFLFAIIFPRWLPGLNPPTNCSVIDTCSYANMPIDWTAFNFFPAYYEWEGNAIRESLRTFNDNADNVAVLLGCDNNTVALDNCTDLPFQCVVRTTNLLLVEGVNITNELIFYLPDLVRFDAVAGYNTFQDIYLDRLVELFNQLVECGTVWYAFIYFFTGGKHVYFFYTLAESVSSAEALTSSNSACTSSYC